LALAAVLAAGWWSLPSAVRANEGSGDDRDEETIEVRKDGDRETIVRKRMRREDGPRGHQGFDPQMREKHEKVRGLEQKVRELSKTLRQGADAEKASAKTEARKVLGELFDAKLELETAMLAKMEKHAAELKAKIAKKKTSREKAIESRLSRMTGEGDDW
jgi:uncharacterized protein YukE